MSALAQPYFTPEEYIDMERRAEFKSEYDCGQIFAMAGASRAHNLVSGNVFGALQRKLAESPCEVYSSDMRVQAASASRYSYPDVAVVCGKPEFLDAKEDTLLNPLVLVEVLSPSTESKDRGEKFLRYRRIEALSDYLLVSQDAHRVEHFQRQADGSWRLTEAEGLGGSVTLDALGCVLPLAEVYAKVTLEQVVRLVLEGPR